MAETTEKTHIDGVDSERVLVTHTSRSSESIIKEGHVEREKTLGGVRKNGKIGRDGVKKFERGERGGGLDRRKEGRNFLANVCGGLAEEAVVDENLVGSGAGGGRRGNQGAIMEVATTPKVHGGSIPMIRNKHIERELDGGEFMVLGAGRKKLGPDGQKGDIKGPKVFKGGLD